MFAVLISILLQHVGMHEHINFNILEDLIKASFGKCGLLVLLVHNPLEPPPHHRQKLHFFFFLMQKGLQQIALDSARLIKRCLPGNEQAVKKKKKEKRMHCVGGF